MYEVINLRNKWKSNEELSPNKCPNTPNVKEHVKMKEQ